MVKCENLLLVFGRSKVSGSLGLKKQKEDLKFAVNWRHFQDRRDVKWRRCRQGSCNDQGLYHKIYKICISFFY